MDSKKVTARIPKEFSSVMQGNNELKKEFDLGKLLNDKFLCEYTEFVTIDDLVDNSPYNKQQLLEDPDLLYSDEMNRYIDKYNRFYSTRDMLCIAAEELFGVSGLLIEEDR